MLFRLLVTLLYRWRRLRLLATLRIRALASRTRLEVEIARDVRITGRPRVSVAGERVRVRIGSGTVLEDDIYLFLDGGTLEVGPRVRLRLGAVLRVRGHLTFEGDNFFSYYSVIHSDERVLIRRWAGFGEHVTITDSSHLRPPEGGWWLDHITTAPVDVGEHAWVGAKVTISRGVTIGEHAMVAANAVVIDDIPGHVNAGGVPARILSRA